MLIKRLTSPTTSILSTDEISQWLRIEPGSDPLTISMLMTSAVDYVRGYTGQVLLIGEYRIDLDSPDCTNAVVTLPGVFPITAITDVTVTLTDGSTAPDADYIANLLTAVPTIAPAAGSFWPTNTMTISVTVTAGYATPASVPASLRHAVAVLMGAGYDSRAAVDPATLETVHNLCARYRRDWIA